ncbi:hypothetical protein OROMI_000916 [Orobanche minor]
MRLKGNFTSKEAETLCIREALRWAKNLGYDKLDIETDVQQVFYAIHFEPFNSSFRILVDDVKEIVLTMIDVSFYFARRSANCAAHTIAREANSESGCGEWHVIPPLCLVHVLQSDLMH